MDVEILKDEKNELEFRILVKDPALAELIVDRINQKNVDFCAYRWEHPVIGYPKIIIKAKEPKKVLKETIKELIKEVETLEKAFK